MSPRHTAFTLSAAGAFRFDGTARSHGWVALAPNRWDEERRVVHRAHRLGPGRVAWLTLSGAEDGSAVAVDAAHVGPLTGDERRRLRSDVTRMFRLEEDLSEFHELCRERGGRWKATTGGLGRLLRSPTLFEDVVKTILTTNVQWGGTVRMVRELVEAFGEPVPPGAAPAGSPAGAPVSAGGGARASGAGPGRPGGDAGPGPSREPAGDGMADTAPRAFPTPEALAEPSVDAFADRVGLGYRAPYVHELARRVASGELVLEPLADSDAPTSELKEELLAIRGVGPYAASTLLMLVGRYDELAVDSVFRDFVARTYFDGDAPSDEEARAVYEGWGTWKYLAYWFDLWLAREARSEAR